MFRYYTILNIARTCLAHQRNLTKHQLVRTCPMFLQKDSQFDLHCQLTTVRSYAKSKNKMKEDKGKGKKKHVEVNETFLSQTIDVEKLKADFEHSISHMKETFISHISLRSTTGSIENLPVAFEGNKYTLIELGQIIRKNPKTIIINMNAFPQAIPAVLKAISSSGMNLNPQQDGTSLFIPVPKVTREYRESLAKNAKAQFIKCRDSIRNVQNKCLKDIKKKEKDGLSEDDSHLMTEQVKQLGDLFVSQAEKLLQMKESELLGET